MILSTLMFTLNVYLCCSRCNETNQIEEYKNIINKLYPANSNQIYNMTGCLSKCDRYSYAIKPTTDLTRPTWNKNNDSIALWLYVSTGETEVREQVSKEY